MRIRLAICDERLPREAELSLMRRGFRVMTLPPSRHLSAPVASHTDMLLFKLGDEYISFADYCDEAPFVFTDLTTLLPGCRVTLTADEVESIHPKDARMNALLMGNLLFARADSVSEYIKKRCTEGGIRLVPVKQGYPACTTLRLTDRAAITADLGMAKALSENGVSVTVIGNGGISLPPYDYGFIGGCAGVYENTVYFIGDIDSHPDAERIKNAISALGMTVASLYGGPLLDLGGILFAEGEA